MTLVRRFVGVISCCYALAAALSAQTPAPAPVAPASEFIAEIRTHGNARVADDEVVRVAGFHVPPRFPGPAEPAPESS